MYIVPLVTYLITIKLYVIYLMCTTWEIRSSSNFENYIEYFCFVCWHDFSLMFLRCKVFTMNSAGILRDEKVHHISCCSLSHYGAYFDNLQHQWCFTNSSTYEYSCGDFSSYSLQSKWTYNICKCFIMFFCVL